MNRTIPNKFKQFLWWCSTANRDILIKHPTQQRSYTIIGSAVLLTWSFATLSWSYFFSTVNKNPLVFIPLGIFFGLGILVVDRVLIYNMKTGGLYSGDARQIFINISSVLIRLFLAFVIGNFIGQPLVLFAFKKDVSTQISIDNGVRIENKKQQINDLNSIERKRLINEKRALNIADSIQYARKEHLQNEYIGEADGTSGTGKVGYYSITKAKEKEFLDEVKSYKKNTKIRNERIKIIDSLITEIEKANNIKLKEFIENEMKESGFLTQIEALTNLMKKKPELKWRYYLIVFIIILFEIIPVISKIFMKKDIYEEKLSEIKDRKLSQISINKEKDRIFKDIKLTYMEANKQSDNISYNEMKLTIDDLLKKWAYMNSDTNEYKESEQETTVPDDVTNNTESLLYQSKNIIEVILSVIFLFILVYIFNSGNIEWYIYISFISFFYTLSKDLSKYYKTI